jgi:two-component system, LytTR family, response regulator
MKLRAIIIDDEPPARTKIRKFAGMNPDLEVVGEAGDGMEAIAKILELRPDLIFLDIQMPRGDGFEVLREVYPEVKPLVIFTTAFDEYAIRAFEVEALDYLLKPFTVERFRCAVDRAVRSRSGGATVAKMTRLLYDLQSSIPHIPRILVRNEGKMFFLKAAEIEWVEAEEKYVLLHTRTEHHLIRKSISALENELPRATFVRVHRGHILNLEALKEIASLPHGDSVAILKSGVRIRVGRNYREALVRAMGGGSGGEQMAAGSEVNA